MERDWCALQGRAACSYFQSWGWIGAWLNAVAAALDPLVVRVWQGRRLVGLGTFVEARITRRKLFASQALFLNECPLNGRDMVIEYNGLLAQRGHEAAVYGKLIDHLLKHNPGWDELHLGALPEKAAIPALAVAVPGRLRARTVETSRTWQCDLAEGVSHLDGFLATLSRNRRGQIRRSLRLYREHGELRLEEARDVPQALSFFEGLKTLHTGSWKARGLPGAFANPIWERFHRHLITTRLSQGEVQLVRVAHQGGAIGYIYSLIWRRRVYVVQTGFEVPDDKRLMPGYVCHALNIVHNRNKGRDVYDLMHGDDLYKRILCDRNQRLLWIVLQKRRIRFHAEDLLVGLVRRWRRTVR